MHSRNETNWVTNTQCGCQALLTGNPIRPQRPQQLWTDTLPLLHDLENDLGPCNEAWFDDLTAQHEQRREAIPPNRQTGWSPCPAGGVVNIAASTPHRVKTTVQCDSPALWPALLADSPTIDFLSTPHSKSASSEDDEHNNSTAVSFGFPRDGIKGSGDDDHNNSTAVSFGFPRDGIKGSGDGEGGEKGAHGLLAFSMDSADLSWSSSMATPPNTAVDTFPVTEEEERQKGPARALFSPNTSAADSELGDTDFNTTIEQEEASLSLFAADTSHATSPLATLQGPCASCKKRERRENGGLHLRATSCSCQHLRVPVVEIHDERTIAVCDLSSNENAEESLHIQRKASLQDSLSDSPVLFKNNKAGTADVVQRENGVLNCQVQKEIDSEDTIPGSPLRQKDRPFHWDLGEVKLRRRRTSTPRTPKFKSWSQAEKGHATDTALSTRRCSSLQSTPIRRGRANLSSLVRKLDTSPVVTLSDPRVSKLAKGCVSWKSEDIPESSASKPVWKSENDGSGSPMKRANPGSVDSTCETGKATSLDEALADFFSSPETCVRQRKHAPGKAKKRLSEVLGDCGEENPTMKTDTRFDPGEENPSIKTDTRFDPGEDKSSCKEVGPKTNSQASLSDTNLKNRRGDGTDSLAEDLGHVSEETRHVLSPSNKVNGISSELAGNSLMTGKESLSERDGMWDVSDRTPQKRSVSPKVPEEQTNLVTFVCSGSPPVLSTPTTPLSILRSSKKRRHVSSSHKRVHFAEDCKVNTLSKSKKRLVSIEAVGEENNPKPDVSSSDSCRERGRESEPVNNGEKNECKKAGASAENKMESGTRSSVQFVKMSSSDRLKTTERCGEDSESGSRPQTVQQSKLHKVDGKTVPGAENRRMHNKATMHNNTATMHNNTATMHNNKATMHNNTATMHNKATPVTSSADDVTKVCDQSKAATALKPPAVSWTTCSSEGKLKESGVRNTDPLESCGVKSAAGVGCSSAATEKHKGQDAVTPVGSVSQPKLRLGLKKTPRFLYPSSSQILESCPQNVYCFQPADSAVKSPSSKVADDKPAHTPAPGKPEYSTSLAGQQPTNTADQTIAHLSIATVVSHTPQPPAFSKDHNIPTDTKASGITFQGSQSVAGTGTGLLPQVSMPEDEAMEEEPDWSDIEDSAVIEAGVIGQEEDLGSEILCDMDFSQELLSQAKVVTGDEDVDGSTSTRSNADHKVTDLKPQGKDNQTACEKESDEGALGRPVEDCTSKTEKPAEKAIEERTLGSLPPNSDKTASLLEPVRAPNSLESVSRLAFRQEFDESIESAAQSNLCDEQAEGKVNSVLCVPAGDVGGFSTAGGKSMVLSDKALNAAKALFQEEDMMSEDMMNGDMMSEDMMNEESFKNDVKSTSDELLKLKGASDSCEPLATFREERQKRALDTGSKRVPAATEQPPSVSWGASEAAGTISSGYSDGKTEEPQTEHGHTSLTTVYSATELSPSTLCRATDAGAIKTLSGFSGFKSASGKDFVLSSKGQRKAEDMWKAVESELQGNENIPDSGGQREAEDMWKVAEKGLQSNKKISTDVSAGSSLAELQLTHTDKHSFPLKTKEQTGMVSQDSMETSSFSRASSVTESSSSTLPSDGMGFQTAGGKLMNLSSKAREKALALWESVGQEFVIPAEPLQDEPPLHSTRDPQEPSLTHKQPDALLSEKVNDDVVKPETSCEKLKPATLKLAPPSNVPQGFRPFKAPTVLRKVTEEERYTLKEPEKPAEVQKNTLLNHFSNTRSEREIRVSKRRRSDDFSDDDEDTWGIETMDVIRGESDNQDYEQKAKPTSSHLKSEALESGRDSVISLQGSSEVQVKLEQKSAENKRIDSVPVADDEMSDAVLSELTNDMYEGTQSVRTLQKPPHSLPTQSEKDGAKDTLLQVDVQFLKQFPSQDSQKSINMVNLSFDSLRCDDNVSYEEKDSARGKVSANNSSSSKERIQDGVKKQGSLLQSNVLDTKESDFDSSILDLAADFTFSNENGQNESVQSDQEVVLHSSYVERDALDMSCMENELDASHVEVSGGVVWLEKGHDNTDSRPDNDFLLTSLDALKEEKSSGVVAQEGQGSTQADNLKELSTDTSFDANDSALLVLESACELSSVKNVLKRKAETSTNIADKRPRTEELPSDTGSKTVKTAKQNFSIEPPDERDSKAETSPVDSLANVSWTDITSTFNPSQWGGDGRGLREDANDQQEKIEKMDSRMCPEQTLSCGGANAEVSVSACTVSKDNRKTAGNNFAKSIGVSGSCEQGFDEKSKVKTVAAAAKGQGIPLKTSNGDLEKRDSTLANAEDFQITSGMSQFCSTQFSQVTKTEEHAGSGLQTTLQRASESRKASGEENRKPNREGAEEASTSKVSMAEAHPTSSSSYVLAASDSESDFTKKLPRFQGFQTAHGKPLQSSKKSLEKVQALFQGDFEELASDFPALGKTEEMSAISDGLSLERPVTQRQAGDEDRMHCTAAEHTPSLSERDSGVSSTHTSQKADSFSVTRNSVASQSLGFQTASGKTADCSVNSRYASEKADSFSTAKDGSGKTVDCCVKSTNASEKADSFCKAKEGSASARFGFQTASGKAVAVSEMSVEKVKRVLDSDVDDAGDMSKLTLPGLATDSSFAGFKSAAGGTITVSECSVSSARSVLETGDGTQGHVSGKGSSSSTPRTTPMSRSNLGFQTAGGSSVTVSKKSLDRATARQVLEPGEDQQGTAETERNSDELCAQSTASFQGFQTARGSFVSVSDRALNHARKVFNSDEDESLVEKDSNLQQLQPPVTLTPGAFRGFQTARGTGVSVSESALNHARKVLQSVDDPQLVAEKDSNLEPIERPAFPAPRSFPGFQTAGGTSVSVSDKALTHARSLFHSEDVTDKSIELKEKSVHSTEQEQIVPKGAGFQTAGGKKVTVKKSSLSHAKTVFAESSDQSLKIDDETESTPESGALVPRYNSFHTANGSKVSLSANSLQQARKVLESTENKSLDQTGDSALIINKGNDTVCPPQERPRGFQTAGGKSVTVSENALKNARKVLESAENESLDQTDDSALFENKSYDRNKIPQGRFLGFQTAGGKSVTVSGNALKNARKVLESAENENFAETDDSALMKNKRDDMDYPPQRRPHGFQTAGGKSVTVSENALKNARKVLESAENESLDQTDDSALGENKSNATHNLPQTRPLGFQTAGGKHVTVSENALKNARKVLESAETSNQMTETESENENVSLLPKSLGFQTAQGASVSVSKKSLQHVQKVLASDQNFEATDSEDLNLSKPRTFGFQTARGENVNISSKSLQHAKSFFKDDTQLQLTAASLDQVTSLKMDALAPSSISNHDPIQQATTTGECFPSQPDKFAVKEIPPGHSAKSHQQYQDVSMEPSECEQIVQPMGGQERRGKESFQPMVSDDTEECMEGVEETEPRCVNTEKVVGTQRRVTVKRTALYADTEAVLHDRSAKRFKLQPATALDMNSPQPSSLQKTPHHLTPKTPTFTKSTTAGNPTPSFQPPYKKSTFTPPTAKKTVDTAGSTPVEKPGFIPPASVAPGHCNTEGSVSVTSSVKDANAEKVEEKSVKDATLSSNGELSRELSKSGERGNENLRNMVGHALTANSLQTRSSSGQPISTPQAGLKSTPVSDESQSEHSKHNFNQSALDSGSGFCLEEAMMRQEKIIRQKKRQMVRPLKGRWLIQKSSHRQTKLEDLHLSTKWRSTKQLLNLGVSPAACSVNSQNAEDFRFHLPSFYPGGASSVLIGDSALLVPDRRGYAGKEEFYSAFLTVDGVDPGLVTQEWVSNHYRWIVWKLAAYEVTLPRHFASRTLTPDVVMFQLKYRYDREVDGCQRSALKRIVERDDTACKRLVLCVSDIKRTEDSEQTMLEVTDGWYSVPCKPDSALQDLIDRKKLTVGHKIVTTGAELAGSQESCSPLELCTGLHLKVSGNSTRPAPACARLGYQRCPTPLCVPLSTLHPQGGLVGCVDVVVVRKYPLVFMEKPAGGGCIFRSADMEEKARRKHEEKRQTVMEKLCSQLQAQMEKEEESAKRGRGKLRLKRQDIQALTTGAEISEAMDSAAHPEQLQSMLSGSQFEQWLEYRHKQQEEQQQRLNERLQQAMQQSSQEQRTVVPLQKLRIVGCCRRDVDSKTSVMLTVWRPGPDWDSVMEGKRYCVYSLTAAQSRCRTSGQQVELTAGRQTRLQPVGIEENLLDLLYEPREVYSVTDVQQKTPPHSEFDFVGLVVSVRTALRGSDAVYAVDTKGDVLLIWFWGGLQSFSLQDTLTDGAAFSASNLRLKASNKESVECCASLELSLFSTTGKTPAQRHSLHHFKLKEPRAQLLELGREKLADLRSASRPAPAPTSEMVEDLPPSFLEKLMEPLTQESTAVKITAPTTTTTTNNNNNSDRTTSKDTINASTSLNESLNTSTASSEALSPTTKRKRAAQREKLARLKSYGRAPCLSPLPVTLSPAVGKAFKPLTPHRKQ